MTDRRTIAAAKFRPEPAVVQELIERCGLDHDSRRTIEHVAADLVEAVRARAGEQSLLDAFMQEFGLGNDEGVALMCLAESLLRIPDSDTVDDLIADKLGERDWREHLGRSDSTFVNASTWALMLTGSMVTPEPPGGFGESLARLFGRVGEPVIRTAVRRAMGILGNEFVLGRNIGEAVERGRDRFGADAVFSFDMLGEGARTAAAATRYLDAYESAIHHVGALPHASVSIKLSALHPRYEYSQHGRAVRELTERVSRLARAAAGYGMSLAIDAEEADRLALSLDVFEQVLRQPDLDGWHGLGFVVQAYGRRALPLIDWLARLARDTGRTIPVRLVKGAYWDAEIKHAQVAGYPDFPVFTRKANTDLSYLVCAERLLDDAALFFPQFATHNAHTLVAVRELALRREVVRFEFQRLHGMGELLYRVAGERWPDMPAPRVYAPVGSHEDLLAYLVRRLLENGANSSFVNRFLDRGQPAQVVVRDPITEIGIYSTPVNPRVRAPGDLYGHERKNSAGEDLTDETIAAPLLDGARHPDALLTVTPIVTGRVGTGPFAPIHNPATGAVIGQVVEADADTARAAMSAADAAQASWDALGGHRRADVLLTAAEALAADRARFIGLAVAEAGKTLADAVAEVREAEDFCRYYAVRCREDFGAPEALPGPNGETNELRLCGRGVFVCISPWNFPLAIFAGQVTAALAAGNAVVAKPAEQTPAIAARFVRLLHASGVPEDVLHLITGPGEAVAGPLLTHGALAGVAFTGGTDTATHIQRTLAGRAGAIVPLIAETGGLNAMIVDSSALLEQVADDVVASAFGSAGQRCSALRLLCLQADIANAALALITGAMDELVVGDPAALPTDVGPVIEPEARSRLLDHIDACRARGQVLHAGAAPGPEVAGGWYVQPHLIRLGSVAELDREHFGPVLHVVSFERDDMDGLCDALQATGYGLTLGIHTRIDRRIEQITARLKVGNTYVNRNMVGAVVGTQPFGGRGLSGTGPKAGGPRYLPRFATERVLTINTMARGGDIDLLRG